jgi:hypothetical protein
MTGFDKKALHATWGPDCVVPGAVISVEIDFVGNAGHVGSRGAIRPWSRLTALNLSDALYTHYVFEQGFSAHWVRFSSSVTCGNVTAWLTYS